MNWLASVPAKETDDMVAAPDPLLVTVNVVTPEVVLTAWLPKLKLVGLRTTVGKTPAPVSGALFGLVGASEVT